MRRKENSKISEVAACRNAVYVSSRIMSNHDQREVLYLGFVTLKLINARKAIRIRAIGQTTLEQLLMFLHVRPMCLSVKLNEIICKHNSPEVRVSVEFFQLPIGNSAFAAALPTRTEVSPFAARFELFQKTLYAVDSIVRSGVDDFVLDFLIVGLRPCRGDGRNSSH